MLNRLNGWQRVGVVLTALWLLFVSAVAIADGQFFQKTIEGTEPHCSTPAIEPNAQQTKFSFDEARTALPGEKSVANPYLDVNVDLPDTAGPYGCVPGASVSGTPDKTMFHWGLFFGVAFVPALIGWMLVYLSIAVVRWVVGGFRRGTT